jgi:hypothetical protein
MEPAMGQVIDFQIMKCELMRHKVQKSTELSNKHAARAEWLKKTGGALADQVKASLEAAKADADCISYEQKLEAMTAETAS